MTTRSSALMSTYARYPVLFEHGEGCRLVDVDGKSYLDFLSGLGVNNLGHAHPSIVNAVRDQVGRLIHTSNLYGIPLQEKLAKKLTENSFAEQIFFCNSGAEANEAAIKLTRKHMKDTGRPGRYEIITTEGAFHGRTLATLTATGQAKVQTGYDPLPTGFRYVPYNTLQPMEKAIGPYTAAIMVEPVQGEAGIQIPDAKYLAGLREIADRHEILLILDEVQTGMGRTGTLWAHEQSGMTPDIMTVSKAMASGLPMGACLATATVAASFSQGCHGSTFGGNPLACRAALATLDVLLTDGVLKSVPDKSDYFLERLNELRRRHKLVKDARAMGFMAALELNAPAEEAASVALSRGLLINCTMGTILRFLPPLTATRKEIDEAISLIDGVLKDVF